MISLYCTNGLTPERRERVPDVIGPQNIYSRNLKFRARTTFIGRTFIVSTVRKEMKNVGWQPPM